MMEGMRDYLLSVIAAAVIGGIVNSIAGKGAGGSMIRLIAGLFLTFTLIQPVVDLNINSFTDWVDGISQSSTAAVTDGLSMRDNALRAGIKDAAEAYILDKACRMDVSLAVEIGLSDDELPVPESISLSGNVSPYAKQQLQALIAEDLGIDKEHQKWT